MTSKPSPVEVRLRPHHIMCQPYMILETFDRGEAFNSLAKHIKEVLESQEETLIEVTQGVDDLCRECPLCRDGGCRSPDGDETEVRKWDAIITRDLGISYGERQTAGYLRTLTRRKVPLKLCLTKCRWRSVCRVMLGNSTP
ncbi:MAG: DUF1284 domain-containing protein [Dehalococcoidia bacterium]|nr:DUF1284 domain-containing protein [Dehalococcoidia bacterium]